MTPADAVGSCCRTMTENGAGAPMFEALSVPHTVNDFVPSARPASAVTGALDHV